MFRPMLYVTVNQARGLALVRGPQARRVTHLIAEPAYSASGRGWVIPSGAVEDLWCYAWTCKEYLSIKRI